MFSASAGFFERDAERMGVFLNMAEDVICKETVSFSAEEWASYIERYMASGMGAVHHSQIFREAVRPAYRIISSRFLCILPILEKAARLPRDKGVRTLVLDGRAAAGKSTRAEMLKTVLDAEVIHMDDFFLPPVLRSTERLEEPGGNVHYERFMREVLPFLEVRVPFTYRRFSCSRMDYDGERKIGTHPWRIVEGSYSQHPLFGDYGDLRVFCDVEPEEQMRRIVERNGAEMAEMFKQRWIPMEERYFEKFKILSQADVCLKNEKVFVQY